MEALSLRCRHALALAVIAAGCSLPEAKDPPAAPPDFGADAAGGAGGAGGGDAAGGAGGVATDGATGDAAPADGGPDDAAPVDLDASTDAVAGDASTADAGDADAPDGDLVVRDPPEWRHVAAAKVVDGVYVTWYADRHLYVGKVDEEGGWASPPAPLSEPMDPPEGVAAYTAGSLPWIAVGHADHVRLYAADVPDAAPLVLDVRGAPVLGAIRDRLLVVGRASNPDEPRDAPPQVGWQLVDVGDDQSSIAAPMFGAQALPMPDSAVGYVGGAVLRFAADGQCLQLGVTGTPVAHFPCPAVGGGLIGDGASPPFTLYEELREDGRVTRLLPAFAASSPTEHLIGKIPAAPVSFPPVGDERPLVTIGTRNDDGRRDRIHLAVVGYDRLLRSQERGDEWPYPDARLAIPGEDAVHLVRFGPEGPALHRLPTDATDFGDEPPYGFEVSECVPSAETCDGRDEDCDSRPDNGVCCPRQPNGSVRTHAMYSPDDSPTELLVADLPENNRVRVAFRNRNGLWRAYNVTLREDPPEASLSGLDRYVRPGGTGIAIIPVGDATLLITADAEGRWIGDWHHATRDVAEIRPPGTMGCDVPLDVALLERGDDGAANAVNASVLVACRNGLFRHHPWATPPGGMSPDRNLTPPGFPAEDAIDWITLNRPDTDGSLTMFIGTHDGNGVHAMQQWSISAASNRVERQQALSVALRGMQPADLARPVRARPTNLYRLAEQQEGSGPGAFDTPPRFWTKMAGEYGWREPRLPESGVRFAWARNAQRLYGAKVVNVAPKGEDRRDRLRFWTVDVTDGALPALWALDRFADIEVPTAFWGVADGAETTRPLVLLYRDPSQAPPGPGGDIRWRFEFFGADCLEP